MKNLFTETLLIAFMPYLMILADLKDWLIVTATIVTIIWVIIQIIHRITHWGNKK